MKFTYKDFALLFIFSLCINTPSHASGLDVFANQSGTIAIAGGTAHIPVMKAAAKRIMMKNADIRITIAGGGSGVGIQKVGEGLVSIGNAGRAASEKEKAKYNLTSFSFAIDGVATAGVVSIITALRIDNVIDAVVKTTQREGSPFLITLTRVVKNHVENHFDANSVQRLDHLLELVELSTGSHCHCVGGFGGKKT